MSVSNERPLPEFISHPLCPFNQRCVIGNLKNGWQRERDFRVTYVALGRLPEWFLGLSAGGPAFPTLRLAGITATDATAIFEYSLESGAGTLQPGTAHARVVVREWVAQVGALLNLLRGVFTAHTGEEVAAALDAVFRFLGRFERAPAIIRGIRNDAAFNAIDAAIAPFFSLALHFDTFRHDPRWQALPGVAAWGEALLADEDVQASTCAEFDLEFERFFEFTGGVFASR